MATFKVIATATVDAASDTSLTSAFAVPGEMSHYAIAFPDIYAVTATCNVHILVSDSSTGTFKRVQYSANPSTAVTAVSGEPWSTGIDSENRMVICEALMFAPSHAKLQFVRTATANTDFVIYGRKFD